MIILFYISINLILEYQKQSYILNLIISKNYYKYFYDSKILCLTKILEIQINKYNVIVGFPSR